MAKRNLKKIGVNEILGTNILEGGGKGGGMGLKFDFSSLKKGIKRMFGKGKQSLKITKPKVGNQVILNNKMYRPNTKESFTHKFPGTNTSINVTTSTQTPEVTKKIMKTERSRRLSSVNEKIKASGGRIDRLDQLKPQSEQVKIADKQGYFNQKKKIHFEEGSPATGTEVFLTRPKGTDFNRGVKFDSQGKAIKYKSGKKKGEKRKENVSISPMGLHEGAGYKPREFKPYTKKDTDKLLTHGNPEKLSPKHEFTTKTGKVIHNIAQHPQVKDLGRRVGVYNEKNLKNQELSTGVKTSDKVYDEEIAKPVKIGGKFLKEGDTYSGPTTIEKEGWAGQPLGKVVKKVKTGKLKGTITKIETTPKVKESSNKETDYFSESAFVAKEKTAEAAFRKDLATKIKAEPNKKKRKEMLMIATGRTPGVTQKKIKSESIPF